MSDKITIELDKDDYAALKYALSTVLCNDRTKDWLLEPQGVFNFASEYYNHKVGPDDFFLVPMTLEEVKEWDSRND